MENKQKKETSFAIYLINCAVAILLAVVAYFNGPELPVILGYFLLVPLTSLLYDYKICLFTAGVSVASYGLVIAHLIQQRAILFEPSLLFVQLGFFIGITIIIAWLAAKLQKTSRLSPVFETKDKTRQILDSLDEGAILLDRKERIILINPVAEKILAIRETKILQIKDIGQSPLPAYQNLNRVLLSGKNLESTAREEITLEKPRKMILQVTTTLIKEGGKILGALKMIRDITHEKEVDQMKSELISIVSHQLRTPLSAVKWGIKMLLDGDAGEVTAEQKDILAKGYRSNERMIHLVNDLLNVSHIEERRFQYKFVSTSLENLVESTINEFTYSLEEKKIALEFQKAEKPLPLARIDASKIHVVLQNLLSNAVNYTPSGSRIEVKIENMGADAKISIKDGGMGIPESQKPYLFQKFFRADNAVRLQTEGSGLGLFIARNIIQNHKGKIWAESEENKGSTFYFTLPIAK